MTYKTIIIWKVHKLHWVGITILAFIFWFFILGHYTGFLTDMTFTFWLATTVLIMYYLIFGKYIYPTLPKKTRGKLKWKYIYWQE